MFDDNNFPSFYFLSIDLINFVSGVFHTHNHPQLPCGSIKMKVIEKLSNLLFSSRKKQKLLIFFRIVSVFRALHSSFYIDKNSVSGCFLPCEIIHKLRMANRKRERESNFTIYVRTMCELISLFRVISSFYPDLALGKRSCDFNLIAAVRMALFCQSSYIEVAWPFFIRAQ